VATEIDICNLALSHIGDRNTVAVIRPPENSAQAAACARFFDIARDTLLAQHPWSFATKRAVLADLTGTVTVPPHWLYAYSCPSDVINRLVVLSSESTQEEETEGFVYELGDDSPGTRVIYTNVETAYVRYTARVTNPAHFPPMFTEALSRQLASYLAGPIIKGEAGVKMAREQISIAQAYLTLAAKEDANQSSNKTLRSDNQHQAPWIANRGALPDILDPSPIAYD
jgi:hypothetical protein